ncbi:MAG: PQQ-binding-like beta-propeller repeat protein [Dehalococcoidales bacterium]|nr:PQQ-binding-like beta-propeller repeat protein [Dehalococcoidales bacterium]MDD3264653.1 PQQ-binding-like beta-propeller repeat protein [Dehalococcoidales bacterium]MDD4322487.1 PQQ-binding-like beta-propeller repeat protein [Dehalococcoidales bacterium]MDD4793827.1 PQQ-binding-like beta-propeller repeat protein [Dehalococcoidales bacterium]MDD5497913.1 PQQ-binding-like beta-propeller repeat protein [Dehalococcoidales bacterium]
MHNNKRTLKVILLTSLLALGLIVSGCVGMGTAQSGWSGVVAGSQSVYLGSGAGKLVALNSDNGFYQWQEDLEASAAGGGLGCAGASAAVVYSTPVLYGETVYIGDGGGRLYAFNVNDRQSKNVVLNTGKSGAIIGSPLIAHESVYVGSTDGNLYAYDAASLTYRWQYNTGGEIWAAPAVWGNSIFAASFDKKLYSIDAESGQSNWDEPFETNGPIIASPLVYGDVVIIASLDRHVYAVDAETGELVWSYPAGDNDENAPKRWLWATPVTGDGKIYIPGMDGKVYVIEASAGGLEGIIEIGESVASTPVFAGNRLVLATESGKIYSVDTDNYQKIELRNIDTELSSPLGVDGQIVFVHSVKGNTVYAINGETGALLWSTSLN